MIRSLFKSGPMIGLVMGVLACGLLLAWPGLACAQAAPQPLPLNIINAVQLDEPQKAQIKAFAGFWTAKFTCQADPAEVERARDELIRPVTGINQQISPAFRFEYSTFIVPPLQTLLSGGCPTNQHVLPNVVLVLEKLGTDRANNVLLQNADVLSQKAFNVRLAAARGCQNALAKAHDLLAAGDQLAGRKFVEAARKLRDAVGREDEARIMWWQLGALNTADGSKLDGADRAKVRDLHVEAVNNAVKRMLAKGDNPNSNSLIEPLQQAISDLRNKFITNQIPVTEAPDVAKKLGWSIGQVLQFVVKNWEAAQDKSDAHRRALFAQAVGAVEGTLPTLDGIARGPGKSPATNLRKAWEAGDKAAFEAETKKWIDVLGQPPYIKP